MTYPELAAVTMSVVVAACAKVAAQVASGPPTVHPTNPRYVADGEGTAVYLTGSHTWSSLQDIWTGAYFAFDFNAYLNMLESNGHNFIRMWRVEMPAARYDAADPMEYSSPHPWRRTGPGFGGDGGLKFDLAQFDQTYFDRLRARCIAAGQRGMYVSVMLFEGHCLTNTVDGWFSHPFKLSNNVNSINGDPNNDGIGRETHTLAIPAVTAMQEAYVRRVIDTINDLDNVVIEISNESPIDSTAWQNHMIAYVHQYQASKPQQHLVWFSTRFPADNGNTELWASDAEVIAPGTAASNGAYRDSPPANNGSKIIINDTDHLWGCGGTGDWVWKSFVRGLNPIYMEGFYSHAPFCPPNLDMRAQMGHTLGYATRMDLAHTFPSTALASTGWCLADADDAYLVYAPSGGPVTLNLASASGVFEVEWFNPGTGQITSAPDASGGGSRTFNPPFSGSSVLFVAKSPEGDTPGDINGDDQVDIDDLLHLLAFWGPCTAPCGADIAPPAGDGLVNIDDLLLLVSHWEP
jgi:hypothetical protein